MSGLITIELAKVIQAEHLAAAHRANLRLEARRQAKARSHHRDYSPSFTPNRGTNLAELSAPRFPIAR